MSMENINAITRCLYAIAGAIVIVGAFKVLNDGANSAWKPIVITIAATVALCGAAAALQSIYNLQ